jgi:nitrogen fixation protein NifX
MKVAFSTSDGSTIDRHFGRVSEYHVWEVGPHEAAFLEKVSAITTGLDEEDRTAARASALAGCAIVYTVQVGGPAAAKLVAQRIHPMKTGSELPISEAIGRLQAVLRGSPPPWLRKALSPAS